MRTKHSHGSALGFLSQVVERIAMVMCKDCGRLGVIDEYTDELREATKRARETGRHQSSQGNSTLAKITCHAGVREFNGAEKWKPEFVCKIINLEFECP